VWQLRDGEQLPLFLSADTDSDVGRDVSQEGQFGINEKAKELSCVRCG
jgi:hypothetical protein